MHELWHTLTVARFSWIDLGVLTLLWSLVDVGKAFVRGWRRRAAQTRQGRPGRTEGGPHEE